MPMITEDTAILPGGGTQLGPLIYKRGPRGQEVDVAQARFGICKGCAEALEGGFGCRLSPGCCFGQRRSERSFKCPAGRF